MAAWVWVGREVDGRVLRKGVGASRRRSLQQGPGNVEVPITSYLLSRTAKRVAHLNPTSRQLIDNKYPPHLYFPNIFLLQRQWFNPKFLSQLLRAADPKSGPNSTFSCRHDCFPVAEWAEYIDTISPPRRRSRDDLGRSFKAGRVVDESPASSDSVL